MCINKDEISTPSAGNTPTVRSTDQEKVRKIFRWYINQSDVKIYTTGLVEHPAWEEEFWEAPLSEILKQPYGTWPVKQEIKNKIKKFIDSHPLEDTMRHLTLGCIFGALSEAKEYLSTDDFSRMFRLALDRINFCYNPYIISKAKLLELFKCCNLQKFMTAEEWKSWEELQRQPSETETVYRGYVEAENAVVWTNNRRAVTGDSDRFGETYDSVGYKAEIHKKDIIAVIHGRCEKNLIFYYEMYVLDPDKLQNIEPVYLNELCNWDYPDVDDWDYPDVDDWDEWAE